VSVLNPITYSRITVQHLLNRGGYAILSAGRNLPSERNLSDDTIQQRTANLIADLTYTFVYSSIFGMYNGANETSFFITLHNTSPNKERAEIIKLGKKYNQESVIYTKQATPTIQQFIYTTGNFSGGYVIGEGYIEHSEDSTNTTDNYSRMQLCSNASFTFTLNFDFKHLIIGRTTIETQQLIDHHTKNRMTNQQYQN
jgi:hypothetical protein